MLKFFQKAAKLRNIGKNFSAIYPFITIQKNKI